MPRDIAIERNPISGAYRDAVKPARAVYQVVFAPPGAGMIQKTQQSKSRLLSWLSERNLEDQVEIFEDDNPYNTILVESTDEAAEAIEQAPGVDALI